MIQGTVTWSGMTTTTSGGQADDDVMTSGSSHCRCTCHLENYSGLSPVGCLTRPGSSVQSRPQSAPPALQLAYLRTQLMRQQRRAQLSVRLSANPEYLGRHRRCFGVDQILDERSLRNCVNSCANSCVDSYSKRTQSTTPAVVIGESIIKENQDIETAAIFVVNMRTNYQALPKHNNVLRGNKPHFCNFVKHKQLHERTSLVPAGSHERRRTLTEAQQCHYRRQDRLDSVTSGRQARPSSPVDEKQNATESHVDNDVIRVNIRRKKSKVRRKRSRRRGGGDSDDENGECRDEDEPGDGADQTLPPPGDDPVQQVQGSETSKNADSSSVSTSSRVRPKRERRPKKHKKPQENKEKDEPAVPEPEEKPEEVEVKAEESVTEPTPPSTPLTSTIPAYVPLRKESDKRPTPKPKAKTTKTLAVTDFSKYIVDISPKADNISPNQEFYSFATNTMSHGEYTQQKSVSNPWSQGRLALSQQSSRFELPMDMKVLETMTPTEYLSKYCVVTSKRQWLYEKIYLKHKEPKLGGLNIKGLDKALKEALVDTVTSDDVKEIIELVGLDESSKIDQKLFTGIAAMTERLLYPKFVTDDTQNIKDHKKEKIECADFCALDWKLHGVNVNPDVKKLLESL